MSYSKIHEHSTVTDMNSGFSCPYCCTYSKYISKKSVSELDKKKKSNKDVHYKSALPVKEVPRYLRNKKPKRIRNK